MAGESTMEILTGLGMPQYIDIFLKEGFDTWTTICDATEADLDHMDVKLGHRRKLQRAIHDSKASPAQDDSTPPGIAWQTPRALLPPSDPRNNTGNEPNPSLATDGRDRGRTKRKYRRHPKPDANAPVRPPSAYVLFAQDVREQIKEQELDFSTIAKTVGARWQALPAPERDQYDQEANGKKDKFSAEMAEYRKTKEYDQYQKYLQEFKKRNDGKEAKARRTEVAADARLDDQDGEGQAYPRRRSSDDETRPSYKPLQLLQIQSSSQSPDSRSSPSVTPVTRGDDGWASHAHRLHGWGSQSANQRSPPYRPSPVWPQGQHAGPSPQLGATSTPYPMRHTQPSAGVPPYPATTRPPDLQAPPPRSQNPYRRSNLTAQDPQLQPRDGRGPRVPALLNPTGSSPQHAPPSTLPRYDGQTTVASYNDSASGRAQWRADTLPGLYHSTSSLSSQSFLNTEDSRPSPPRSPHTGRMIDGELTPPPRPAEAATAAASSSKQQFPLEKTMEKTSRRKDWEHGPGTADALLDHEELGSYRPKQNVSEMRSRHSPRSIGRD